MARHVLLCRSSPVARGTDFLLEEVEMKKAMLKLSANLQTLMLREEGQDLIEYALVVALIAFAATTGMKALATGINTAFGTIATTLSANMP
jgi:pilus assembly protein Flp/PilA